MTKFDKKVVNAIWFAIIEMAAVATVIIDALLLVSGKASSYWLGDLRCWIGIVVGSVWALLTGPIFGDYILDVIEEYVG